MKRFSTTNIRLAVFFVLMVSLVIVGCSRGPNEKQLKALEDTKAAALSAEQKSSDCNSEKAQVEKQLAEQKQKLESMKQEKAVVVKRLAAM
jgi:hypothetical protein